MSAPPPAGWYPDPELEGRQRWWDGGGWTEQVQTPVARQDGPTAPVDTGFAAAAHLTAIPSALVVMAFIGPLIVWLVRQQDPFVRGHAAEATNFQLSTLLWVFLSGIVTVVLLVLTLGLAVVAIVPFYLAWGVLWLFWIARAAMAANRGEHYRYPFTIRFLR